MANYNIYFKGNIYLRGYLYESWDEITNGTGQQTRSEEYIHLFINYLLILRLYEAGMFSILSQLGGISLVQGEMPAYAGQYFSYK